MRLLVALLAFFCTSVALFLRQDTELSQSKKRGAAVFEDFCINCHMANGEGVPEVYPPLAKSDYLVNNRTASIRGVKFGQRGPMVVNGVTYDNTMMPLGLDDDEIADVMNFILNSWGNKNDSLVTPAEVAAVGPR
jgi:mono/diheme cytochrome c family protein